MRPGVIGGRLAARFRYEHPDFWIESNVFHALKYICSGQGYFPIWAIGREGDVLGKWDWRESAWIPMAPVVSERR